MLKKVKKKSNDKIVKKNDSFKSIWNKLKTFKKVAMTLHYGPDGDSLGACQAMKYVLERNKCKVDLVSYDNVSETLAGTRFCKDIRFGVDISELDPKKYDAFIFLDSNYEFQSGKLREKYTPPDAYIINIDHHDTNKYFGNLNNVEPKAVSTCSILLKMFKDVGIKFDKELSSRLLLGLATDSGHFKRDDAQVAMEDAVFLMHNGADYYEDITKPLLLNIPLRLRQFNAFLIDNVKTVKDKKSGKTYAYALVPYSEIKWLKLNKSEIRGGTSHLVDIKEFDFAFTLAELPDHIKGGLRSKGVDISLFAEALDGGGHKQSAGFQLSKMSLKDAEKKILKTIRNVGIHSI